MRRKRSGDTTDPGNWTQSGDGMEYPVEKSKYITLRQLHHDQVLYPAGKAVWLTDDQADPLIAQQAVVEADEETI